MVISETERCGKCILPLNYKIVDFDNDGICSLCRESSSNAGEKMAPKESKLEELQKIVDEKKNSDLPYNCIVPLSGGMDSAYVAYIMKKKFGMKVMGLNIDNGFRSIHAISNLDRITKNLEIDLVTLRMEPNLMGELFGFFFKEFGYFCNVCNAVGYILIGSFTAREARRLGSPPLVVGGWSKKYEHQPGVSLLSMEAFARYLSDNKLLFRKLQENILVDPMVFKFFIQMGDARLASRSSHFIQLPDYMDWDYREIEKIIERELGVKKPGEAKRHHYDCLLHPLNEYLKYKKWGLSQETLRNSVLIREGRMTREEALKKEEEIQKTEPEILEEVFKSWNLNRDEIAWDRDWSELW